VITAAQLEQLRFGSVLRFAASATHLISVSLVHVAGRTRFALAACFNAGRFAQQNHIKSHFCMVCVLSS
jgi:hypothetical protein